MQTRRLASSCPDIIVAVAVENSTRVYAYGITERGMDFMHDDSGDPPNICGRSKYGWQVEPARLDGVCDRARINGLFVCVSCRPACDASHAMKEWRNAEGITP